VLRVFRILALHVVQHEIPAEERIAGKHFVGALPVITTLTPESRTALLSRNFATECAFTNGRSAW
jgi:hypothetical protein